MSVHLNLNLNQNPNLNPNLPENPKRQAPCGFPREAWQNKSGVALEIARRLIELALGEMQRPVFPLTQLPPRPSHRKLGAVPKILSGRTTIPSELFSRYPWRGGFSSVNFYDDLYTQCRERSG